MEERYQSIAKLLLAEIEAGAHPVGKPLPTREDLAKRFKVARATIDRAVISLVKRGALESTRGSGTFVAAPGRDYHFCVLGGSTLGAVGSLRNRARKRFAKMDWSELEGKAARARLSQFDGLLWICPEARQLEWADALASKVPQIIVNRHIERFNYVSTDHHGAIKAITSERLAAWPDAQPFYLFRQGTSGLVWGMREEGFVDACRDAARFYEMLPLPQGFDGALDALSKRFGSKPPERRLIIVSGLINATGAVMAWGRSAGVRWGEDVRYSDFDDDYPLDTWGLKVASFIQDYDQMLREAVQGLVDILDGRQSSVRKLMMPRRVVGDT